MARFGASQIYDPQIQANKFARMFLHIVGTIDTSSSHLHFMRIAKTLDFDRVLDAGSGKGRFSFWLAQQYPHARIDACDISAEKVNHCTEVQSRMGIRNLKFYVGDLRTHNTEPRYDFVFSNHVMEHIPENRAVIRRLSASLRIGGHIYIQIPSAIQRRLPLGRRFTKLHDDWAAGEHVGQDLTLDSLCTELECAGCQMLTKRYTEGFWGELRFELSEMALRVFHSYALFACMYPLLKGLGHLDSKISYSYGNGILTLARKVSVTEV
jgi:SAM-dependent methyltransferase